jgi:hypothetical protein
LVLAGGVIAKLTELVASPAFRVAIIKNRAAVTHARGDRSHAG